MMGHKEPLNSIEESVISKTDKTNNKDKKNLRKKIRRKAKEELSKSLEEDYDEYMRVRKVLNHYHYERLSYDRKRRDLILRDKSTDKLEKERKRLDIESALKILE